MFVVFLLSFNVFQQLFFLFGQASDETLFFSFLFYLLCFSMIFFKAVSVLAALGHFINVRFANLFVNHFS